MRTAFYFSMLVLPLFFFLPGCGSEIPAEPAKRVRIAFQLPVGLTRPSARLRNFQSRLSRLELIFTNRAGETIQKQVLGSAWDNIVFDDLPFPRSEEDEVAVDARVWDKTRDGNERGFAVLSGRKVLDRETLSSETARENISVRLSLQVSVTEYD